VKEYSAASAGRWSLAAGLTEKIAKIFDQLKNAFVADSIVDEIGILAGADDSLTAENGKVLRDVGIGRLYFMMQLSHRPLPVLKKTENFQAEGMRHGLKQMGNVLNLFFFQKVSPVKSA
jgi:hypothetical protein